jgi:hypothetical protein
MRLVIMQSRNGVTGDQRHHTAQLGSHEDVRVDSAVAANRAMAVEGSIRGLA